MCKIEQAELTLYQAAVLSVERADPDSFGPTDELDALSAAFQVTVQQYVDGLITPIELIDQLNQIAALPVMDEVD